MLKNLSGWIAAACGPVALYAMSRIYLIKARPFWNHWQVYTSFYGSMLALGPLAVGTVFALAGGSPVLKLLGWPIALGLTLEAIGLCAHARSMRKQGGEGAASHFQQVTAFGKTYWLRNAGLGLSIAAAAGVIVFANVAAWLAAAALVVATALIGRALFYVLVIPTTMPGAFFWRNKGFEEHARKTGLAKLPQVGVLPDAH
jgi:DMSO reductase anchor subunit